ncbi:helix-turn-helix transcriptional regulator [Photobacterium damselae]
MFNQFLAQYRKKNNLTQQEMVDRLTNSHPSFSKLDTVTLSRWENEKTLPPLKKQFLVFNYIDKLQDFIDEYPKYISGDYAIIEMYLKNKFENSHNIISMISDNYKFKYNKILNDNNIDIKKFIRIFFCEDNIKIEDMKNIIWRKDNQIESCLIYYYHHKELIILGMLSKDETGFRKLYRELYEIILNSKNDEFNICVFDDNDYKLLTKIGGKVIKSNRLSKELIKYTFKFDRIEFLSNKNSFFYYKLIKNKSY